MVMDSRSRKPLQRAMSGRGRTRYYMTEHAYVKDDAPDTNFGYPATAVTYNEKAGPKWHAIFKFDNQIVSPPTDFSRHLFLFASVPHGVQFRAPTQFTRFDIGLIFIKDNFDPSAITWNIYAGLTKRPSSYFLSNVNLKQDVREGTFWKLRTATSPTIETGGGLAFYRSYGPDLTDMNGAYGVAVISKDWEPAQDGNWTRITFERQLVDSNYAGYLELF